jgi:hypothetical protein
MKPSTNVPFAVEFHQLDIAVGWEPAPGAAPGIEQKILADSLDEKTEQGARTRLIRFLPGSVASNTFVHPYWEEVYLLEGELIVGNNKTGGGRKTFVSPCYACRPPGTVHGPFTSPKGCLFLEIQYFS